jgi:hypothetical protein
MTDEPIPPGAGKAELAKVCSLCGNPYTGFGNNPEPLRPYEQRCCNYCNQNVVIPARLKRMKEGRDPRDPQG